MPASASVARATSPATSTGVNPYFSPDAGFATTTSARSAPRARSRIGRQSSPLIRNRETMVCSPANNGAPATSGSRSVSQWTPCSSAAFPSIDNRTRRIDPCVAAAARYFPNSARTSCVKNAALNVSAYVAASSPASAAKSTAITGSVFERCSAASSALWNRNPRANDRSSRFLNVISRSEYRLIDPHPPWIFPSGRGFDGAGQTPQSLFQRSRSGKRAQQQQRIGRRC